ncbi:uncharacterized protein [Vicugna pacos]
MCNLRGKEPQDSDKKDVQGDVRLGRFSVNNVGHETQEFFKQKLTAELPVGQHSQGKINILNCEHTAKKITITLVAWGRMKTITEMVCLRNFKRCRPPD